MTPVFALSVPGIIDPTDEIRGEAAPIRTTGVDLLWTVAIKLLAEAEEIQPCDWLIGVRWFDSDNYILRIE